MAIDTNYVSYGQGYTTALYTGGKSTAVTVGTGSDAKQSTLATELRESAGVEVTLSPGALQALAAMAGATTDDTETAIGTKLRAVLDEIFLNSTREAKGAEAILPKNADTARRKVAQQATDFIADTADNPFEGRSQSELAMIVVDPDGLYTINERRAAFVEFGRADNDRLKTELTLTTDAQKQAADAELPKSNDPARVSLALQATEFVNDRSPVNPFVGKTRDQLTAIIDNDNGDYTTNERLSALAQRSELEKSVRQTLANPSDDARRLADREKLADSDPAHLARAQQAMRFTYGLSPNPFAGLTREELSSIVYDETKTTYTVNERRAAYAQLSGTTPPTAKAGQALQASVPGLSTLDQFDPYSATGAYNAVQMRQVLRANNTSMLLGLLNQTSGSGGGGSGLLGAISQPGAGQQPTSLLNSLFGV